MSNKPYRGKRPCVKCETDTPSMVEVETMQIITTCRYCGTRRTYKRFYFPAPIVYREGLEW